MNTKLRKKIIIGVCIFLLLILGFFLYQNFKKNENTIENGENEISENTTSTQNTIDIEEGNKDNHEEDSDYIWSESDVKNVILKNNATSTDSDSINITKNTVTISNAGTYSFSGTLDNGQIIVDTEDDGVVRIILNGVNITSLDSSPIYIKSSEKTIIILADNTTNYLTDSSSYIYDDTQEEEPNSTIFSKDDLTIYGNGSLVIDSNFNDGIVSKDGLIIKSGNITVTSVDDGIRGKDYLIIKDGTININAKGDGLKSDNDTDTTQGYISIENGTLNIISGGDAINAITDISITNGDISLNSGGGSTQKINGTISSKGLKAGVSIVIDSGVFAIDSSDDAIHSNDSIYINGGTFNIASGDDGIHADTSIEINSGDITITKSYEGIESSTITINGGNIDINATDDGLNVAGGNDNSSINGRAGQNNFNTQNSGKYLYINGGNITLETVGDGVDVNGSIVMTDGTLIINGPTSDSNGALDYDGSFQMNGGTLIAVGSSGMLQTPSTSSQQYSVSITLTSSQSSGTSFSIQTEDGENIIDFTSKKSYRSVIYSSPKLKKGTTYSVLLGNSKYTTFTVSNTVTSVGSSNRRF